MIMLVIVILAAVRLTVAVNQAEETSRQLHIASYSHIYRVSFLTGVQDGKIPSKKIKFELKLHIFCRTHLSFQFFGRDFAIYNTFWAGPVRKDALYIESFCYKLQ